MTRPASRFERSDPWLLAAALRRRGYVHRSELLQVDSVAAEIIGVLPPSFKFLRTNAAMLLPMQLDRAGATGIEFDFQVLARLKPGGTIEQARHEIRRMIPLLPEAFEMLKLQPNVRPLARTSSAMSPGVLWILFAAVGVVLLVACGNVANLFLIRAEASTGTGDALRAWRQPRPPCEGAADRERVAGPCGRCARPRIGAGHGRLLLHWIAPAEFRASTTSTSMPRYWFHAGCFSRERCALRPGPVMKFGTPNPLAQRRRPHGQRCPGPASHA